MGIRQVALALIAATAALVVDPSAAAAQYYHGQATLNGPTVSPYLQLLNNQNNFGLGTYQSLVRPQVEQRQAINRQGAELQQLERQSRRTSQSRDGARLRATGHTTRFFNYSHYYPDLDRRR